MIGLSPNGVKIMVATQPVDFRRGMNGLVALVASALSA
ncbi:IS66 family insertion sequence element accessory protein TnpB, partial [Sinorhizobium meliloti]|nr:IS66 family insertion sequence element accessory protein TnpB [Sinorhizobium meliloti]MCM5691639.1 IS66 family insertion sequence element accessory protein TnpB [Sinorhizobium meliloti]